MDLNLLYNIYEKKLLENEKSLKFWEKYLVSLEALDFSFYTEKLTVPALVPIGNKIFFRGELKHTNEITVSIGSDYFAKCSVGQAEILRQHRIKDAKSKLKSLTTERDFLQNQISFCTRTLHEDAGQNIIEVATEEEDKAWREKHRENVRQYKLRKDKNDEVPISNMSNDELWQRLEELELQEELEQEMAAERVQDDRGGLDVDDNDDDDDNDNVIIAKHIAGPSKKPDNPEGVEVNEIYSANDGFFRNLFHQPSKLDLFEKVVDRHNAVKAMVTELKARKGGAATRADLQEQIGDMEVLDLLEDEMGILEDMLESDDDIEGPDDEEDDDAELIKSVAFAGANKSDTFEITFRHSKVEPSQVPYDSQNGITKPNDLCEAFPSYFHKQTISILKKTKSVEVPDASDSSKNSHIEKTNQEEYKDEKKNESHTIAVGDVVEKVDSDDKAIKQNEKPMSLFKKRRQQKKE